MSVASYLDSILLYKKQEVDALIQEMKSDFQHPLHQVARFERCGSIRSFAKALRGNRLAVIAEVKRRSPTCGEIRRIEHPENLALEYLRGGASAISVVTDGRHFGGSLQDLTRIFDILQIHCPTTPILRKDFIIHPVQIAQSRAAGASAILLIVRAVRNNLKFLMDEAARLGLEVLTEVHDEVDLELALESGANIIGVNNRDLTSFETNFCVSEKLRPLIPSHIVAVAESGVCLPSNARHMRSLGFDAVLVGEALVRSEDPGNLIKGMRDAFHES